MRRSVIAACVLGASALGAGGAQAQDSVFVGHLADFSGATAFVGKYYGQGVQDALNWVNQHGGIDGTALEYETIDYSYKVPQAISAYKKWTSRRDMIAMQGWGTADTEALISFVAKDEIPVYSASYSGHLTDPTGKNPRTEKPAPYNFFYGPSYSDGCRALVQWAADDAKEKEIDTPKFVHLGDNHPYPNAPKEACADYATELGFEVLEPVVVSLKPGDFKAQCLTIKEKGANYAFMANLGGSVVSLLKSCDTVGTEVQFMANVWGGDYRTIEAAGETAQNYLFVAATPFWESVPENHLVREISELSEPETEGVRSHHYLRGICSVFYMKEAMEWAKANGGIEGENIKQGMYQKSNWVPEGLDGVCLPSTWTAEDHRGTTTVFIQSGSYNDGDIEIERIATVELPRRDDWIGY